MAIIHSSEKLNQFFQLFGCMLTVNHASSVAVLVPNPTYEESC